MGIKDKLARIDWSTVCTAVSCVGVIGTGIFSGIGGVKMANEWDSEKSLGEKAKIIFKHEWPAMFCGAVTIGCALMGRHISKVDMAKMAAELSAATAFSASQMNSYRAEVREEVGAEKEAEMYNKSLERVRKGENGRPDEFIHRFRDPYNKIWFDATMSDIWRGMDYLNQRCWNPMCDDFGFMTLDLFYVGMGKSDLVTKKMMMSGWTPYILEEEYGGYGINFRLDPKKDRFGQTYYIILFDKEPCEDIERREQELDIYNGTYER